MLIRQPDIQALRSMDTIAREATPTPGGVAEAPSPAPSTDTNPAERPVSPEEIANVLATLKSMNNTIGMMSHAIGVVGSTMNGIDLRLRKLEAAMENTKIVKKNRHTRTADTEFAYIGRQKEVYGSGTALAQEIHGADAALPPGVDVNPPAAIGSTPGDINPFEISDAEILRLISFYNETFDIVASDEPGSRRWKLLCWLSFA